MDTYIYLLITMLFSAFFSGMEIAFVSVDKLRFEMEREDGLASRILAYFFRNSNNFISTMLVGNNIALVIYGILMAQIINVYLLRGLISNDFIEVLVQTIISTLIILVTGEFLPKTLFKINPNLVLKVCAFPLMICYVILYPVSQLSSGLSYLFLRLFGMKINKEASEKAFGKVDLDYFVQSSIDNAEDEEELDAEVKIFQNALDFSSIKIRDCIVPRTEVVAVDRTASMEDLKSLFVESGISKIIVYDGNIDNVVGYIHSSEMFRNPKDWHDNVKEVPIVPETMAAHKLMKLFMQQKKSLAVVVDEFGGTSGIVSLEDLVEEIFGDIEDEHDNTSYVCKQIADDEYVLSGRLEIGKVNETFNLDLPEEDDYLTVGGLILNRYQSFPKLHEVVTVDKFQFKIIKVTATKIELVRLKVTEKRN
ncbi:hemolysin family protein [uncultured Bacteroides sp.]|uniref:hemolysin family protein n=1 Tax=uncultured Bacteroides sp. TaxID=162156 RepID=UPI0026296940|nr:hemolysin family protein [uncultured Bacteroides sp.]